MSEEKSERLDGRGSEAASFAREGQVIRYVNRKTTTSHARFGGPEGTDPASAVQVHPAPTRLETGYSRDRSFPSRVESLFTALQRARATVATEHGVAC